MTKFIPLSVPNLSGNEKKYVNEAIESEWVSTAGSYVDQFEKNIADYLGIGGGAVACQSGTAGIHLALLALGISSEHEIIVPTLTFIAAVNPVRYVVAEPIFMDCDDSLCMDIVKLEEFCKNECELVIENPSIDSEDNRNNAKLINKTTGRHIKALIIVHVFGNMCDMEQIMKIARKYDLCVVEDATEALGTKYIAGEYVHKYAGTIGDVGIFSFNGNKIITTGGGGMVVSNKPELLSKIKYLSTQAKDDEVRFIHNEVGYNYRMTNIQAALGVAQLELLEDFIRIKAQNYLFYKENIKEIRGLSLLGFRSDIRSNYWFYSLMIDNECYPFSKDALLDQLSRRNIQARPIWQLIHTQKPYQSCQIYKIEKAIDYYNKTLNIPCSTNLNKADLQLVIQALKL